MMDELIRKKDALDALMAERKHLLAKGQKGAEHVLTHHGYNVIDELPTVQSDVPVINVGDMIYRQAAIDAVKDAVIKDEQQYAEDALKALPSVQPNTGYWEGYLPDGLRWKCSECGSRFEAPYNFCPHCGARMER